MSFSLKILVACMVSWLASLNVSAAEGRDDTIADCILVHYRADAAVANTAVRIQMLTKVRVGAMHDGIWVTIAPWQDATGLDVQVQSSDGLDYPRQFSAALPFAKKIALDDGVLDVRCAR